MQFAGYWERIPVRRFIIHTVALAALCVVLSFLFGIVVVGGPVLYGLGFSFYGGLGYIALAMATFFVITMRERLLTLADSPRADFGFVLLGLFAAVVFWLSVVSLNAAPAAIAAHQIALAIILQAVFLVTFGLLIVGAYGREFLVRFVRQFRSPLLLCVCVGVAFYASMQLVWQAWPFLSYGVSRLVYLALLVFPGNATLIPPMTLRVGTFGVFIGEACSGVFSIFIFSALFLLLIALDWRVVRPWRAILLFVLAVIGLFLVNVLRVYLILLVGVFYSPEFAVGLFHSYVGTVLFLLFFIGFLWLCSDWMRKPVAPVASAAPLASPVPTAGSVGEGSARGAARLRARPATRKSGRRAKKR